MNDALTLAIGLPNSGKTTFLAALWQVVNAQDVPEAIRLDALADDLEFLNGLRSGWLRAEPLDRTRVGSEQFPSMQLRGLHEDPFRLEFPDLSGESFKQAITDRTWTAAFDSLVAKATGFILFVEPHSVRAPVEIAEVSRLAADLEREEPAADGQASAVSEQRSADVAGKTLGDLMEEESSSAAPPEQPAAARGDELPIDVALVELSQLLRFRLGSQIPRLAIIVSAWDVVEQIDNALSPRDWLSAELPLLCQYLDFSNDVLSWRVWGISAQGGRLSESTSLLDEEQPSMRVRVRESAETHHDITIPIKWLLELI